MDKPVDIETDIQKAKQQQLLGRMAAAGKFKKSLPRVDPQQFPLWHDKFRGLPNAMARSALFTCANPRDAREQFKDHKVVSLSNYSIHYTGEELRQDDEDVFLQIVHIARNFVCGEVIEITGNQLLRLLKWGNSKKDYVRLRSIINRLKIAVVYIRSNDGTGGYSGNMIRKFIWQNEDEAGDESKRVKWKLYLEPEIINLFANDAFTILEWHRRSQLGWLAKWLHSFYHTHERPYPYTTKAFHALSGSKAKDLRGFRRDLKNAHEKLYEIEFLKEWVYNPETDTFIVERRGIIPKLAA